MVVVYLPVINRNPPQNPPQHTKKVGADNEKILSLASLIFQRGPSSNKNDSFFLLKTRTPWEDISSFCG